MKLSKGTYFSIILILSSIYIAAWMIQTTLQLNCDTTWLTIAAARLWHGGNYAHDFFETTPPFILFLHCIPLAIAKITGISINLSLQICIYVIATLSLVWCYRYLKKLLPDETQSAIPLMLGTLAAVMLILPVSEFMQREHLFIIFILPYLFAIACQLQTKTKLHWREGTAVGLYATLGFLIKPYFLFVWLSVEIYALFAAQNKKWGLRPENIIIILFTFFYLIVISIFNRDYLTVITPFAMRLYYSGMGNHIIDLVNFTGAFLIYFFVPLYGLQLRFSISKQLLNVLFVSMCSTFIFVFLMQRMLFYYHFIPALTFYALLSSLTMINLSQHKLNKWEQFSLLGILFLYVFLLWSDVRLLWFYFIFAQNVFFVFTGITFFLSVSVFYKQKHTLQTLMITAIIVGLNWWFAYIIFRTAFSIHLFGLTTSFLFILFFTFIQPTINSKCLNTLIVILYLTMITTIFYFNLHTLYSVKPKDNFSNQFNIYIKQNAPHLPIAIFSTTTFHYPSLNPALFGSRFPFFWMLPGLLNNPNDLKDKNNLLNMVAGDIEKYKPALIFIDTSKMKYHLKNKKFDFLPYFLSNTQFAKAWSHYYYTTTIKENAYPSMLKFNVYTRSTKVSF